MPVGADPVERLVSTPGQNNQDCSAQSGINETTTAEVEIMFVVCEPLYHCDAVKDQTKP